MTDNIAVIGDVHGDTSEYIRTIAKSGCDRSIQVGDMAHYYGVINRYVDAARHVFFGGNHENYDTYYDCPNALGDYGPIPFLPNSFFIRGAYSIDYSSMMARERSENCKLWWKEEELDLYGCLTALNEYIKVKPKIMFSHDCPLPVSKKIGDPQILRNYGRDPNTFMTRTQCMLDAALEAHQPDVWFFGHYHQDVQISYHGTQFYCIPPLSFLKITPNGEVVC